MTTPTDVLERIEQLLIQSLKPNRRPHKCPICEGKGCIPELGNPPHLDKCLACEKGIVWG